MISSTPVRSSAAEMTNIMAIVIGASEPNTCRNAPVSMMPVANSTADAPSAVTEGGNTSLKKHRKTPSNSSRTKIWSGLMSGYRPHRGGGLTRSNSRTPPRFQQLIAAHSAAGHVTALSSSWLKYPGVRGPAPTRRSMQREFAGHVAPFPRRDQLAMAEPHRVQRPVDLALPELDEFKQFRMVGGEVVILPQIAVEHVLVIGHPVEEFRRGQPVALQHHFRLGHLHVSAPVAA